MYKLLGGIASAFAEYVFYIRAEEKLRESNKSSQSNILDYSICSFWKALNVDFFILDRSISNHSIYISTSLTFISLSFFFLELHANNNRYARIYSSPHTYLYSCWSEISIYKKSKGKISLPNRNISFRYRMFP